MMRLFVFSYPRFQEFLDNVSYDPINSAYISIICSPECRSEISKYNMEKHRLSDAPNVLNLDFDDIGCAEDGCYRGITEAQAKEAVKFIENNIDKDFYIHCRAGKSRSQAFARYILDTYGESLWETNIKVETPNIYVLTALKRAYKDVYGDKN